MKKRIVVLSDKLSILLKFIRAFPILVWHRQNWDMLRPFMTLSDVEVNDLKSTGVYCAGFVDDAVREREDLYDILVDLNSRSVSVSSSAKGDFQMTSIHRDICEFLVNSTEDTNIGDQEVIKGLAIKTKELLNKLESLKVKGEEGDSSYLDIKTLENLKLNPKMERFLLAVAIAEGMTKI